MIAAADAPNYVPALTTLADSLWPFLPVFVGIGAVTSIVPVLVRDYPDPDRAADFLSSSHAISPFLVLALGLLSLGHWSTSPTSFANYIPWEGWLAAKMFAAAVAIAIFGRPLSRALGRRRQRGQHSPSSNPSADTAADPPTRARRAPGPAVVAGVVVMLLAGRAIARRLRPA